MKERLKKYKDKKAEIKRLKYEIKKLEREEYGITGGVLEITGVKPKGYMQSSLEKRIVNNQDKIADKKRKIEELEAEIEYIDTALNILKPTDKRIIELRYKVGLEIKSIMADTGYSKSGVEDCLRRGLEKLNKFEKVSIK